MLEDVRNLLRGNVWVISWTTLVMNSFGFLVWPFFALYALGLGASPFLLGVITGIRALAACIYLPGGFIADTYGRKRIIGMMTAVLGMSYLLMALAWSWRVLLLIVVIESLSYIYVPAYTAILVDSLPTQKRGFGLTIFQHFSFAPMVLCPAIGGLVADHIGLMLAMRIGFALTGLVCIVLGFVRSKSLIETIEPTKARFVEVFINSYRQQFKFIRELGSELKWTMMCFVLSIFGIGVATYFWIVFATREIGLSAGEWGIVFSAGGAIALMAALPIGRLIDSWGREKMIICSLPLLAFSAFAFVRSDTFVEVLVVMIVFSLGSTSILPAFTALIGDLSPLRIRGRVMAIKEMAYWGGSAVATTLGGYFYQNVSPKTPFYVMVIFVLISTMFLMTSLRRSVPKSSH
ncbi:MAG: MFS transporter [Methanocellales archaeon]|nr:MFS transporter [Methanocellales archaeon]